MPQIAPPMTISETDLQDPKLYRLNRLFQLVWSQLAQTQQQLSDLQAKFDELSAEVDPT